MVKTAGFKYKKFSRLILIGGLIVLIDQLTKAAVCRNLALYHSSVIIPGFFNLTHIQNPGGAFGFMASLSAEWRLVLFVGVSAVAIGLILYFYIQTPSTEPLLAGALALVLGGAVGNLIDRIRLGKVVDFLDFYVKDLHWPAFNIADSAVSIGIVIFIVHAVFHKGRA